jgi:2-methylisocitrate lyase-like PEP mutase family enzyme
MSNQDLAARFRQLHAPGQLLVLPNAWDAGSARLIESLGAKAIATTSAGVCWARGYADGKSLPLEVVVASVAEIVRVTSLPVSADIEAGYSAEPARVAETVRAVIGAGAVGINLEDGSGSPDLLAAKISAVKQAARGAGVDVFVNARTDVYLKRLVAPERALEETLARARQYQEAGCDGIFVPALSRREAVEAVVSGVALPLNLLLLPNLAPVAELRGWGVRRVSAGSAVASAALGAARLATKQLLEEGRYERLYAEPATHPEMNALFPGPPK